MAVARRQGLRTLSDHLTRLGQMGAVGRRAVLEITTLTSELATARDALRVITTEVTKGSLRKDGSRDCRISDRALAMALAALGAG